MNRRTMEYLLNYRTSNGFPVILLLFPLLIIAAVVTGLRKYTKASLGLAVCAGACVAFFACAISIAVLFGGP